MKHYANDTNAYRYFADAVIEVYESDELEQVNINGADHFHFEVYHAEKEGLGMADDENHAYISLQWGHLLTSDKPAHRRAA